MLPNNRLEIHCLNVDHGDCTIIRHPGDEHRSTGRVSVVDIHDWKDRKQDEEESVAGISEWLKQQVSSDELSSKSQISEEEYAREYLNDPIDYYQNQVEQGNGDIWRFISTHPDMDHLSGLKRLHEEVGISGMWDTAHEREFDEDEDFGPFDRQDWEKYTKIRSGDTEEFHVQPTEGAKADYWEQDNIDILHPSPKFVEDINSKSNPNYNDVSIVLKINTRCGGVLLPGDAEEAAWEEIYENHRDELQDISILKASHHGRRSGFHRKSVEEMDPNYVVLSVGKKPSTDAHSYYYDACENAEIISTRQHGCVQFTVTERGALIRTKEYPEGIFDLPGE